MNIEDRIKAELDALGDTPDEVAKNLVAAGIKGRPTAPCDCPIANYLKSRGHEEVAVTSRYAYGDDVVADFQVNDDSKTTFVPGVPLPEACRRFISRFDNDEFDELVAPPVSLQD